MARAGPMSIDRIRARAWGERRVRPHNIPSAHRSLPKMKRPMTLGMPSGRGADSPMRGARSWRPAGGAVVGGASGVMVSATAHLHDPLDRGEDPAVSGAATEVPTDGLPN